MAKLYLKFEQAVLKEFPLAPGGMVTIGRLPDNFVQVDNPAVSGHHAKISWETDHFEVEDCSSRNGTFVNGRPVSRAVLHDGDEVLICKHTLVFREEKDRPAEVTRTAQVAKPVVPGLEATMMLDTRKMKELLAQTAAGAGSAAGAAAAAAPEATAGASAAAPAPGPAKARVGMLTVLAGKTEQPQYVLSAKLNAIGKSDMASIKLKGWFAPKLAAVVNHRDNKYFIASSSAEVKVKVNDEFIAGQHELNDGDVIEVAGVKMSFGLSE